MNKDKQIIIKRIVFTVLTAFCIGFIFSRSLMPGNKSGEESSRVLTFLNGITEFLGLGQVFTHNFVRKCAHFTEFSILSVFVFLMYKSYISSIKISTVISVATYSFVSVADETIQYFVPDRACQLKDVLIDVSGSTFGLVLCLIVFLVAFKIKNRKCKK